MERSSSEDIEVHLSVIEAMIDYHGERLTEYNNQRIKLTHELNRARRLEREAKEELPL